MEAMKMEHQLAAGSDGVVTEVRVSPGQQVDAGQVLLVITGSPPASGRDVAPDE
jgi:propionyl-CoA carboxylase alpha chain